MRSFTRFCFLSILGTRINASFSAASYSAFVPPASLWNKCAPVEITVSETQTVIQPGSTVTVLDASTSKSGVVVKTVSATASSPLKRRNFPGYSSNCVTVSLPSFYGYCSASTVTKTVVQYTTSTLPASTIIKTSLDIQPETTLTCTEGCKIDVTATKLIYPKSVIYVTVPITVDTLPESHTPLPLTWEYSGVILTYPTTYLFYYELSHAFLATSNAMSATACPTASDSLTLPSPTNYAPLIYPQEETPAPELPPSALISYLNAQQTVIVQLSGTPIGSSCDPVGGGIVEPVPATGPPEIMYTSTYILAQTTSTTQTLVAIMSGSTTITSVSSSSSGIKSDATSSVVSTGTSTVILVSSVATPTSVLSTTPVSTTAAPVQTVSVAEALSFKSPNTGRLFLGLVAIMLAWS